MNINLTVSVGEAVDKYSILCIKKNQIKDLHKLKLIEDEINVIYPQIKDIIIKHQYHYQCLLWINQDIWDLSEQVRDPNITVEYKNTLFLETFYKNDARFRIKNKFNKLSSSFLNEQKSYPGTQIIISDVNNEHYIRYLSLCYDYVILNVTEENYQLIKHFYDDDPHIIVKIDDIVKINDIQEPITNLLHRYNFINKKYINYLIGGRLGDFIHCLYGVMCNYEKTGKKGNVYITDQLQYGGDGFSHPLTETYNELYNIVISQNYINSFEIYQNQHYDINMNNFRNYQELHTESWLQIISNCFNTPLIDKPWIKINQIDEKYKNVILIHQSFIDRRKIHHFLPELENIIKNNQCMFITCNIMEYHYFKLNHLVSLDLKNNLYEMFVAINSCKLFIGNQSSPLSYAYSMFRPLIAESTEDQFYTHKHYPDGHWITHDNININHVLQINNINNTNIKNQNYGFIMTRCVKQIKHANYWIESCKAIRKFYPLIPIVIIDDNSDYTIINEYTNYTTNNLTIIQSEFPGRAELLPYYYLHKFKLFDKAVIIHDSMFFTKYYDFTQISTPIQFLWYFDQYKYDIPLLVLQQLISLNHSNELIYYYKTQNWKGMYGVTSFITYDYINHLQNKYNLFNLMNNIDMRDKRSALERTFAVLCYFDCQQQTSLMGNILTYPKFDKATLQDYKELANSDEYKTYFLFKIWSAR